MLLPVQSYGEGPDILFLHGFLENKDMWNRLSPFERYTCHTLDLPGHGAAAAYLSDNPKLEDFRLSVQSTLEKKNIQPKVIVGHSLGGYVALYLAKDFPDAHIILLNSNFWTDNESKKKERNRVVEIVKKAKDHFLREAIPGLFHLPEMHSNAIKTLISQAQSMSVESIVNTTIAMRDRHDFSQDVMKLKDRLLIIQGSEDRSTPLTMMMQKVSELVVKVIPDVGHMSPFECPDKIHSILSAYLDKIKHQ